MADEKTVFESFKNGKFSFKHTTNCLVLAKRRLTWFEERDLWFDQIQVSEWSEILAIVAFVRRNIGNLSYRQEIFFKLFPHYQIHQKWFHEKSKRQKKYILSKLISRNFLQKMFMENWWNVHIFVDFLVISKSIWYRENLTSWCGIWEFFWLWNFTWNQSYWLNLSSP